MKKNGCDLVETPARYLSKLGIEFDEDDWSNVGFINTVKKWIAYISLQYENVKDIRLERFETESLPASFAAAFEESLSMSLFRLVKLKIIRCMIYPISRGIADILPKIDELYMFVDQKTYVVTRFIVMY